VTSASISDTVELESSRAMQIEIPDHHADTLKAIAAAGGLSLNAWLGQLAEYATKPRSRKPLKTGRGMFAKYGPAPSAEEIDENRREMFRNFGEDE